MADGLSKRYAELLTGSYDRVDRIGLHAYFRMGRQSLTPTGSSFIPGTRRAEYLGGDVTLPANQRGPDLWFNAKAFANPPNVALGNAGVGIIRGPGWEVWNASLRKVFRIKLTNAGERSSRLTASISSTT